MENDAGTQIWTLLSDTMFLIVLLKVNLVTIGKSDYLKIYTYGV